MSTAFSSFHLNYFWGVGMKNRVCWGFVFNEKVFQYTFKKYVPEKT